MFSVGTLLIVELYITSQFAFFFTTRRGFGRLVGAWSAGGCFGVTAGILSEAAAGVGGGNVMKVECLVRARGGRLGLITK
ncbi:MAG: hypothetical protein V7L01_34115 [Nostoc sp.]|uniref:hypothetical protein n=1 Tax=Nostoc sp. TaxID=1180 RepID=UPI002FFD179B